MINGELKKKAKLSFHMECIRLKGDTDKNIYTNGYINGYREAMADLKNILDLSNTEQTHLNHPFLDRERELLKQRELLETQKAAINIQLNQIKVERIEILQKRKEINRVFHDLKHELIIMNPRCGTLGKDSES